MQKKQGNGFSLWIKLQDRLAQVTDSEAEQAIKVRLTVGIGLLIYFCFPWDEGESFRDAIESLPSLIVIIYYLDIDLNGFHSIY